MQPKDRINKLAWDLFESAKDNVQADLVTAQRSGQLKVDAAVLPTLLVLVRSSLEAGYHKGTRVFERSVVAAINDATQVPSQAPGASKKK